MLIIKDIIEKMDNTLEEAEEYASKSILYKQSYPDVAQTYYTLAQQHLDHYLLLHKVVVNEIAKVKATKKDIPAEMLAIWDYEHNNLTEEYNEVKIELESFKSM